MQARSIENLKNQIKRCLCEKNDGDAVVFPVIFTGKTAQDHLVFVFATVAKDITNLSPHGKYLRFSRGGERPAPTMLCYSIAGHSLGDLMYLKT